MNRQQDRGTFVGVRIPTKLFPFVKVVSQMTHKSLPYTIVYILQLYFDLVVGNADDSFTLAKIVRENNEAIEHAKKVHRRHTKGLTLDDGIRQKIFDIVKQHPCRDLISYEEEEQK